MTPSTFPSEFEHSFNSVAELAELLKIKGADLALLKVLPKNANDKNQIYIASDFGVLYELFDLTLDDRGTSASQTKSRSDSKSRITEARFNNFSWIRRDGTLVKGKDVKAIIYPQYPEARLSGLQTVENTMPQSLSVAYTKQHPEAKRLLVLGRLQDGECIALVCLDFSADFEAELENLPGFERARACKRLVIEQNSSSKLEACLAGVLGRSMPGCRLDIHRNTLPFSGTQVCGYTLEHALGIVPNSAKDGDLFGIELKTHTQVKVTLFTPEPDGGFYFENFSGFMKKYGYPDKDGDYRLTGVHRSKVMCAKSQLTLRVREYREENGERMAFDYDPTTSLTKKIGAVDVSLIGPDGEVAASWSLERLMNCWGVKHNEAVYIKASKIPNPDAVQFAGGYEHLVMFERTVIWCRNTSAEKLLKAIDKGTIFLDPAPKLHATDSGKNKRRAQWRVNDITKVVEELYAEVKVRTIV